MKLRLITSVQEIAQIFTVAVFSQMFLMVFHSHQIKSFEGNELVSCK